MGAATPPCGRNSSPYDVIAFFFLLDFFIIGLAALVALLFVGAAGGVWFVWFRGPVARTDLVTMEREVFARFNEDSRDADPSTGRRRDALQVLCRADADDSECYYRSPHLLFAL